MPTRKIDAAKRGVALGLTLALLTSPVSGLSPASGAAPAAKAPPVSVETAQPVNIHSIVLFPISTKIASGAEGVTAKLDDAVRMKLETVNKFKITRFSRLLPSVQRGLDDKDLLEEDVKAPFADDDTDKPRAAKIADRLGSDAYFIGNLESYTVDAANKKVSLQVTGSLYFTNSGNSAKNIGLSVTTTAAQPNDQIDKVVSDALDDAASQIASSINGLPIEQRTAFVVANSQRGKASGAQPVLLALVLGAVAYFALHHNSSDSGSSNAGSGGTGGTGGTGGGGSQPPGPPFTP